MKVITICGSFKFKTEMLEIAERLQLEGNCVILPIFPTKDLNVYSKEEISLLGQIHKEKIKLSDAIFVVNVDGYIGASTNSEIEFAKSLNKEIMYNTDFFLNKSF